MEGWRREPRRWTWLWLLIGGFVAGLPGIAAQDAPGSSASPHGTLNLACTTCHTSDAWRPVKISREFHHAEYGFPLTEAHGGVTCTSCHASLEFSKAPKTCVACHRDVHQGELGLTCSQCHNTRDFRDRAPQMQAHALSRFPLEGAHRAVDCSSCHTSRSGSSLLFRGTPTSCVACHRADFERTSRPNHPAAGFPTDCTSCHSSTSWAREAFDHSSTQLPLTGGHQAVQCQQCHGDGIFKGKPVTCISCHQSAFAATTNPSHPAAHFSTDCTQCHTTVRWAGLSYDHNATQFPLTGAHQAVTCQSCHGDNVYDGKPMTCVSCHQATYNGTTNPPHQAAAFSTDCVTCHNTTRWPGAGFNHGATRFPLTGAHQATTCQACHSDGVYHDKPATCLACHQNRYAATTNPPHQSAGFPTDCTSCHTTVTWTGAVFNHSNTRFALTGAHQSANCQACHSDGIYHNKPTTCVSCHLARYNATTAPAHQSAGFPTTCEGCHNTATWGEGGFNHAITRFPLTGAHLATTCTACHAGGTYRGTPMTCVSCHQNQYNGTTNPPHQAAGFPTDCTTCHTTTTWTGATFNHSTTRFALTGAHVTTACTQCHVNGVYRGTPMTCLSCHQTDYSTTTNPNHAVAGFPTDCTSCHTTSRWAGATFNHDGQWFRIYSGTHRGRWTTCAQCHSNPASFAQFTCLTCHEHRQSEADSEHRGRPGYSYNSQACYSCHRGA